MKVINDTAKERTITLELTERELESITAGVGQCCDKDFSNFFEQHSLQGLDSLGIGKMYGDMCELLGI